MSQATRLAEEEAARNESEEEEAEPTPAPGTGDAEAEEEEATPPAEETPPAGASAEPPSEAELKQAMERLENEDKRHAKRYREILGDQFELMLPCPRCLESGHIYPPELAPLEPDQIATVDASLGRAVVVELKEAPDAVRCTDCDGWGEVLTGAQNEQGRTKICTRCGGVGWVTPGAGAASPSPAPTPGAQGNGGSAEAELEPLRDTWGRPTGHPHWGLAPADVPG